MSVDCIIIEILKTCQLLLIDTISLDVDNFILLYSVFVYRGQKVQGKIRRE